ncbi:MAG: hypothetical protein QF384_07020 [Alphaproteobacteria bacterium]|jgi:hypothetical protein|nr:hypothetical protein [Alphaproteobacteria bacterium]MDP6873034.1 hypothetical protein [Alphaproteobacteria bacterium]
MKKTLEKLPPGFRLQAFGATLAGFGLIDTVMNLITGIALDGFFLVLIVAGTALFALGLRQRRKQRYQATCG